VLRPVYGADSALWMRRWRWFFLATAGLFGHADGNEWGGFVYRMPDGQLYETDPWTAGHPDDVNGAHVSIPTGAVIVGYVHTHPEDPAMDERMLSSEDRSFINTLISNYGADPNLVAYINTKDETGVAKTYAYDSSHRSATSPGCSL